MLQARQLGNELFVGVHSDEAIMENKGPTVMRLDERCANLQLEMRLVHS
jgi:ethanolamine-phosphate cytidylyltransferase